MRTYSMRLAIYIFPVSVLLSCFDVTPGSPQNTQLANEYLRISRLKIGNQAYILKWINKSIEFDSTNSNTYMRKARLLAYNEQFGPMAEALDHAIRLNPAAHLGDAAWMYLFHLRDTKRCREAIGHLRDLIPNETQYPNGYNEHYLAGIAYMAEENYKASEHEFTSAIRSDSIKVGIEWVKDYYFTKRGLAKLKMGKNREAISDFDKALAIDEEAAQAYYFKGIVLERMDLLSEAKRSYKWARFYEDNLKRSAFSMTFDPVYPAMVEAAIIRVKNKKTPN